MENEIIIAAIGILSNVLTAYVSWFFTRKKYNSEVAHNVIENMENSLEFYKKLSDDNRLRLDVEIEKRKLLENEIQELRKQVLNLTMNICMDLTCKKRIRENEKDRIDKPQNIGGRGCELIAEQ